MMSMAPLLMHGEFVPTGVREALRAAFAARPERRQEMLESAARLLHHETDLDCPDVRELVGLPPSGECRG